MTMASCDSLAIPFLRRKTEYDQLKGMLIKDFKINLEKINIKSNVSGRVKTDESLIEKIRRKSYVDSNQITDYLGIRIIANSLCNVQDVCNFINKGNLQLDSGILIFEINAENSVNKSEMLGTDTIGYHGVHYIIKFKTADIYRVYKINFDTESIVVEIQVKTKLEDTWAQQGHDQLYKSNIRFDKAFIRRYNLVSALLETADQEFEFMNQEIVKQQAFIKNILEVLDIENIHQNGLIVDNEYNKLSEMAISILCSNWFGEGIMFVDGTAKVAINMLAKSGINKISDLLLQIKISDSKYDKHIINIINTYNESERRTALQIIVNMIVIFKYIRGKMNDEIKDIIPEEFRKYTRRGSLQIFKEYNISESALKNLGFSKA